MTMGGDVDCVEIARSSNPVLIEDNKEMRSKLN